MSSDRTRVRADSPISEEAIDGFENDITKKELLVRKRMEDIILLQEQLGNLQLETYKGQEELDRKEIDIENKKKELANRERRLELGEDEIRRSMGEDFDGFREFERSRTPVDSFITIPRTSNLSQSSSPRPVLPRQTTITPLQGSIDLKTENEQQKRELDYLRGAVAESRPPSPLPRTMNTLIKLREITESIPNFDGKNIWVTQFTRTFKRALDSLPACYTPETETSLTRLLISKLNGHAYVVVENLKITKHVLGYFSRVRDLTQSIIDEESKQIGRLERSAERKIEEEGLDVFIRGLPSDYRIALRFEKYTDFSTALICLLQIDKQILEDAKRSASSTFKSRVTNIRKITEIIFCGHCKKQGRRENNCWLKTKSAEPGKRQEGFGGGNTPFPFSQSASENSAAKTGTVVIRQIKYEPVNKSLFVTGTSQELTGIVTLMIDTGAEINLLKANILRETTKIDATETVQLTGISQDRHSTLGTAMVRIFKEDVKFHLVEENFPILSNVILGTEFQQSKFATIYYTKRSLKFCNKTIPFVTDENICVLPKTSSICYCYVVNTETEEGYIPRLRLPLEVYAVIPRLELFEYITSTLPNSASDNSDPSS
ncbi:hypothetical protein M0804_014164 [Polistes exclamans]|nr:hypothetical protein M0804_014164 [Polistes exclamans]